MASANEAGPSGASSAVVEGATSDVGTIYRDESGVLRAKYWETEAFQRLREAETNFVNLFRKKMIDGTFIPVNIWERRVYENFRRELESNHRKTVAILKVLNEPGSTIQCPNCKFEGNM